MFTTNIFRGIIRECIMRSVIIFALLIFNVSCTATNMEVILKTNKSDLKKIALSKHNSEEIHSLLKDLVKHTDEMLKVYLSPERIEKIKQDEQYIEILFDSKIIITSDAFGDYNINKILIPLTGTFGTSNKSHKTIIILGDDDGYISGPLKNSNGYDKVQELKSVLEKLNK